METLGNIFNEIIAQAGKIDKDFSIGQIASCPHTAEWHSKNVPITMAKAILILTTSNIDDPAVTPVVLVWHSVTPQGPIPDTMLALSADLPPDVGIGQTPIANGAGGMALEHGGFDTALGELRSSMFDDAIARGDFLLPVLLLQ